MSKSLSLWEIIGEALEEADIELQQAEHTDGKIVIVATFSDGDEVLVTLDDLV